MSFIVLLPCPPEKLPTEEIPNSSVENKNPPPRGERKLPKSEMKLRKRQIKVRRSFFFPRWRIQNIPEGIFEFLEEGGG